VLDALTLAGGAFDRHAGAGRRKYVKTVGGANLVNAEEVGGIADDDDALKVVRAGYDSKTMDRLIGAGAFSFGDDVGVRYPSTDEVLFTDAALGVLVATVSAQSDDQRGDTATVERLGMIEPSSEDRRGMAVVLSSAEDGNCIGRSCHVTGGIPLDLAVHPTHPDTGEDREEHNRDESPTEDRLG